MKDCQSKGKSNRKQANHAAFAATTSRNLETGWVIDSGATAHMTRNLALLGSLKDVSPISVSIPNDRLYHANLSGRVTLGNGLQLNNVYYVPGFQKNLLSVSALDQVHNISFRNGSCYIDTARIAGRNANGLYEVTTHQCNAASTHETFGHISNRKLRELEKAGKIQAEDSSKCVTCIEANIRRVAKPKIRTSQVSTTTGSRLHVDVFGPTKTKGFEKSRYFLIIIDECTKYLKVNCTERKSDTTSHIKAYILALERQFQRLVQIVRSDNGGEFVNKNLQSFYKERGIPQELTTPRSSFQNGLAERYIGIITEGARVLLLDSTLGQKYWPLAVLHAAFIHNVTNVSDQDLSLMVFDEFWIDQKTADYSRIHPFGTQVIIANTESSKDKLAPRGYKAVYVGYSLERKAIKVLHQSKLICSRDYLMISSDQPEPERLPSYDDSSDSDDSDIDEQGMSSIVPLHVMPKQKEVTFMDADDEIVENDSTPEPSISIPGAFPPARPDISQLAENTKIFIEGNVYRSTKDPKNSQDLHWYPSAI
jgi:transposase InsO family protein